MKHVIVVAFLFSSSLVQALESALIDDLTITHPFLEIIESESNNEVNLAQDEWQTKTSSSDVEGLVSQPAIKTENKSPIQDEQQPCVEKHAESSNTVEIHIGIVEHIQEAPTPNAKTSHSIARQKILQQRQSLNSSQNVQRN